MKNFLIIILLFSITYFSSQNFENKLQGIIIDENISSKVSNVLLFTENSPTIKLNNYENIFVTIDASEVKYLKSDSNFEAKADGMLNIYIQNTLSFKKSSLKDLYCYKLKFNKYLVVRVDSSHKNQSKLAGNENRCDCEQLYSISDLGKPMPQSVFHYYLTHGIPLLSDIGTFDALQFLQIEFLTW